MKILVGKPSEFPIIRVIGVIRGLSFFSLILLLVDDDAIAQEVMLLSV